MARSPIQHERAGLLTPRERLWQAARKLRSFTVSELQDVVKPIVNLETCESYLKWLAKSGFLSSTGPVRNSKAKFAEARYTVTQDSFEAPRVTRSGGQVTQGLATLAMWRAMKALKEFDHIDIQKSASVGDCVVQPQSAKAYVNALARAGYFRVVHPPKLGKQAKPARYRLVKDTGVHPPAITRRKAVFDRNTGVFADLETAQEVCDGLE